MSRPAPAHLSDALEGRLAVAARHLGWPVEPVVPALRRLADWAGATAEPERIWFALAIVGGAYPTAADVLRGRGEFLVAGAGETVSALLRSVRLDPAGTGIASAVRIVSDAVLLDLDFVASSDHISGTQRVARLIAREWTSAGRAWTGVAWLDDVGLREIDAAARGRILGSSGPGDEPDGAVIIPVRCRIVVPEVSDPPAARLLEGIGAWSDSEVHVIGHDLIPLTRAREYPLPEVDAFVAYLGAVRYATAVHAVSSHAADEFAGYAATLSAQGLSGPRVGPVPLPSVAPAWAPEAPSDSSAPAAGDRGRTLLVVGTQEPRKNGIALLAAAAKVAGRGIATRLVFIGGVPHWFAREFDAAVRQARRAGVHVEVRRGLGDEELRHRYRSARAVAMVSLHEGFGLPVVEALGLGVPVLAADHGAVAEVARGGGALLVDVRDPDALADGVASIMTDDELTARLRAEIPRRPRRTASRYAAELWEAVTSE